MPSEAIASYVYRFHNSEVDKCHLITYLDFYQYILKNLSNDHIIILPFDFLLDDLSEVLTYLSTQSQLSLTHPDLEMVRNDVLTCMKVWPKIYGDDSDEIIALPTTSKEDQKVELREEVTSLAAYPQCLKIYRELTAEFSG